MLSSLHHQNIQSALDVHQSTPRLRASVLARTDSQHETGTHLAQHELNLVLVSKAGTHFDGKHKLETV